MVSTGESLSCDPGDVVGHAVGGLAGLVELDQRLQRLRHRPASRTESPPRGAATMRADLAVVACRRPGRPPRPAVPSRFTSRELSGYFSVNPLEVLHRDVDVEVVRARGEDVLPGPGRLVRDDRIDRGVEEHRLQPREHRVERLRRPSAETSPPAFCAAAAAAANASGVQLQHELACGQVVVGPGVEPEQLGVALNLGQRCRRRRRPRA